MMVLRCSLGQLSLDDETGGDFFVLNFFADIIGNYFLNP